MHLQTVSYMAERIVGQGSFGIVFQVRRNFWLRNILLGCYLCLLTGFLLERQYLFWCLELGASFRSFILSCAIEPFAISIHAVLYFYALLDNSKFSVTLLLFIG